MDAPTINELHRLAIGRGFPRADVHDILHDMAAAAFKVASMRDLTPQQRCRLADSILSHNGRPSQARRRTRPRRGRHKQDGVIPMVSQKQRNLILQINVEIGWTRSRLDTQIKKAFGLAGLDGVLTTAQACKVITMLKSHKWHLNHQAHKKRRVAGEVR